MNEPTKELDKLMEEFSMLNKNIQETEIIKQFKIMLSIYEDILKKLDPNEELYLNKYMIDKNLNQNFNELVYAYSKSIENITGKILLKITEQDNHNY